MIAIAFITNIIVGLILGTKFTAIPTGTKTRRILIQLEKTISLPVS
jgi:hypothetical protein